MAGIAARPQRGAKALRPNRRKAANMKAWRGNRAQADDSTRPRPDGMKLCSYIAAVLATAVGAEAVPTSC